ncbi:hypothetical protein G7K_0674-t1 [Saitoella complicata NRRL Y-17804]|uniref:Uncharacterized protein n=2 Tax=Saitoella complicata (strain BCRC 22490 / CBS 7301 / JCM 7358 / NBRC 10748 / NRRL Y-17804) TaxID=698492 RepID=A0A0E9N9H6_SAICN|nr:hypothetical protein G7K_0674-t1 [Saitoella complicata NRRL Y-17804]
MPAQTRPEQPLADRLKTLAKHPQFTWWIGHVLVLVCSIRYFLSLLTLSLSPPTSSSLSYRLAFIGAITTYGVVLYKTYVNKIQTLDINFIGRLLRDDNALYFGVAVYWLLTSRVSVALVPFATYSVFHFSTYLRNNVIPAVSPSLSKSPLSTKITAFVDANFPHAMRFVAVFELVAITIRLALPLVLFRVRAIFTLLLWVMFLRFREASSTQMRDAVVRSGQWVDHLCLQPGTPDVIRRVVWPRVKAFAAGLQIPRAPAAAQANASPRKTQ